MERLELWRDLLEEKRLSGLSVADWCAKEGVSAFTYYYWRKRILSDSAVCAPGCADPAAWGSSSPQWLPLSMSGTDVTNVPSTASAQDAACISPFTLRVGRVYVEVGSGFDRGLLGDVLSVLEARC
jgi:hypothetical protein